MTPPAHGIELTKALQPILATFVEDMRERLTADAELTDKWKADYDSAKKADRVAASYGEWSEDLLQQAAAGWVLTTVFIRFIEDNDLFGENRAFISGTDAQRRGIARDFENAFYDQQPEQSYRGYLEHCFAKLAQVPATMGLVEKYAAIHLISPSDDAARDLIDFWRNADEDGTAVWSFRDRDLSTRFLGDMYQDLSEYAREKYALLQTPEFVEEFILDRTLEPALAERPLEGFKIIDPTCGSGHFLLGAFWRLLEKLKDDSPGMGARERAHEAMSAIHGVDINPFAVAITRFRLMVALMQGSGDQTLTGGLATPDFTVLTGDSLLFGPDADGGSHIEFEETSEEDVYTYGTENATELHRILEPQSYDVVVGNPPYIKVKDKKLNAEYRKRYQRYCKGTYALTVPFMVKFFRLAKGTESNGPAGWVGQITSNSFMQRRFGKPLIENFFNRVDLREVIDSSGAYIPGHGTPTVILIGRNTSPSRRKVTGVLGIQGEPGVPKIPSEGKVWQSIVHNIDNPGFENSFITVSELTRNFISTHPWSLQGGSATTTKQIIEDKKLLLLSSKTRRIGFDGDSHADDSFSTPRHVRKYPSYQDIIFKTTARGGNIRDFLAKSTELTIFPYDSKRHLTPRPPLLSRYGHLWRNRTNLGNRSSFNGNTYFKEGRPWHEWHQLPKDEGASFNSISFAFVATHNHFVLDRGGKVFNRSAPVIKLPEDASIDDHLELLGALNSSTACFWLKQNSHNKGEGGGARVDAGYSAMGSELWKNTYEFTGTTLKNFPLPEGNVTERARRIDELAQELATWEPSAVFERDAPSREAIEHAEREYTRVRQLMIAEQEELDWAVYHLYELTEQDHSLPVGTVDGIPLGTRAFEIALARRVETGEAETAWFARHHSTPVTDIPLHWDATYQEAVQKRLDLIGSDKSIRLLEAPEHKRRWADDLWDDKVTGALQDWLLTRLETPELWRREDGMAQPRTITELAGVIETVEEFSDVLRALPLWSSRRDSSVTRMLEDLLKTEAVPYLKGLRYKPSGLRKRAEWEVTWDAQRREDAGEISAEEVPVPPNYTSADMYPAVWKHRGKLDVPKERFISYPGASPTGDTSMMLGWAGWDDKDKGLAIMSLFHDRLEEDADVEVLACILNGLKEQLPWVLQWHNEMDPELGIRMGDYLQNQLYEAATGVRVPVEELDNHVPATARARKRKKK